MLSKPRSGLTPEFKHFPARGAVPPVGRIRNFRSVIGTLRVEYVGRPIPGMCDVVVNNEAVHPCSGRYSLTVVEVVQRYG